MYLKKALFTIVLLIGINSIYACSCIGPRGFYKSQKISEVVVLVKVIEYKEVVAVESSDEYDISTPMAMEVEVIQKVRGKEDRKNLVIWGDDGIMCREYISNFKIGRYYLLALFSGEPGDGSFGHLNEKETDYYISSCGDYTLDIDKVNDNATGIVKRKKATVPLEKVLKKVTRRKQ